MARSHPTPDTWVFGYGSLVSPASMARTIGRVVGPDEVAPARLAGFGRRWNYGALSVTGTWEHAGTSVATGVMVALGIEASASERCNGVLVRVSDHDLAGLDRRERHYDRTDVTDLIELAPPVAGRATAQPHGARIVTYVPRVEAIEHYRAGRDARRAAIRQDYWDLVDDAFATLGDDHHVEYRATPPPDIPIVEMVIELAGR